MKKLVTILMAVLLIVSMSAIAFAADTQSTEVSLTVDPALESYTLVIPATVTIDPATKSATLPLELKDVNLVWNDWIRIELTSANSNTNGMGAYLVNTEDSAKTIHYDLWNCAGEKFSGSMGVAWYNKEYDELDYGNIEIVVDGEYPGSGTYTDTLTFTVFLG